MEDWLAALGGQSRRIPLLSCSWALRVPTSPVAEVTAIASVLRMLRAARVSIPLGVLGEDRAFSEIPLVQLARSEARCYRQRAGI